VAKVLERLPLTFLPRASQPAGLNHLSSAQFSHKRVLLWVIRLGSDIENDPTYEIAGLKEDYSSTGGQTIWRPAASVDEYLVCGGLRAR